LAIAASRAGAAGIIDLGATDNPRGQESAVRSLVLNLKPGSPWGIRWDMGGDKDRAPACLNEDLGLESCPILILAAPENETTSLCEILEQARQFAGQVILEAYDLAGALAAQEAGFDGVIVKGNEAGGRVSDESTFLLLQRLHGRLTIPYWIQGGIGPDTASAVFLAGAAGVVLCEQFWLATEAPFDAAERRQWSALDGSETVSQRDDGIPFRSFNRSAAQAPRMALGQEIAFARGLADKYVNTAGILQAFRSQVQANLEGAREARALAPDSALAKAHGTRYPILQGPMTRVSDTVEFCASVEANGGLPFLALSLLTAPEVRKLLSETKKRMGERPWGVGLLGFAPAELRQAQFEEILAARPPFAIIAGGRPAQARKLEEQGISTYLHVPSPGLLEAFIRDGARKFIFEGRECGGHVGPRSSFCLWQSAIDVLLRAEVERPDELQIVFAGGIHDRLSAAMVAAAAARLSARGMKIGVLMGTAYLFTHEAVANGAITVEFQRQALACDETVLLESGLGHATRCINTPFAEEFQRVRAEMIRAGKDADEIRMDLEKLNIGRLRIASKGLARASDPRRTDAKATLVTVPEETQRREGMYMIGQVAGLRNKVVSMAELHSDVSAGQCELLQGERLASAGWSSLHQSADAGRSGAVAIVGMACMFPGAKDVRRYWENICKRIDAVGEVPAERWRTEDFFSEDRHARDRVYSKWGGFLEKVLFDPVKWRIPPATLKHIEPIQLLSLEVASQAVADAGYDRRPFPKERAGVLFAVAASHDMGTAYCFRTMMRHYLPKVEGLSPEVREDIYTSLEKQLPEWTEDSFAGFLGNVVAGRIARELDFNGPNFTVDAACAASLAALYTAVEQLRTGTSDLMLVGGADGTNNPLGYMSFAKTHALSPRGRSRSFDDSADGIALGEGIACVVLKRLEDAERDGDKIYAIIKGIGCSSDGKNRSLTAPYPPGQARAVNRAYEDAGVSPATVGLIEAHGTGTAVGDACELTTLTQVFSSHTSAKQTIGVGSVKSQIGHTKTVAGLASVIKASLALKHRVLPPTIGIDKPSTRVDWANSPFYLNTETRPWTASEGEHPRRAGVSSFGFGGTNFHVVLEEYTGGYHPSTEIDWTPRAVEVFVLQRASRDEIVSALRRLEVQMADAATEDLAGLASSVFAEESTRPGAGVCRLSLVADSVADLRHKIRKALTLLTSQAEVNDPSGIYHSEAAPADESTVCFLYPGQGSQAVNMLRDLAISSAWSRSWFAEADRLLADELFGPLSRWIYPAPAFTHEQKQQQAADLRDTRLAQPSLGLVELFATDLLERFGIRPSKVAGHSYGEHVALQTAGCLSRQDLLRLSAARGRVCAEASESCPGAMASVQADADTTRETLKALHLDICLANHNAPDQTVVAGPAAAITTAVEKLTQRGVRARVLPVTAAFHTPMLAAASRSMEKHLAGIALQAPSLPVYSNTTGEPHSSRPEEMRRMLVRHISEPVLFEKEIRRLHADGARIFVEVGPGKVLTDLVSRILKGAPVTNLALDVPGREGWTQLAHVLARLAVLGLPVRWAAWFQGRGLPSGTVAEFLAREKAASTPRPSDWVLTPNKAEPAIPPKPVSLVKAEESSAVKAPAGHEAHNTNRSNPCAIPLSQKRTIREREIRVQATKPSVTNPEKVRRTMSTSNEIPSVNGHTPRPSSSADLFAQFQATTRILLETQQAQNRILERYLEAQQRVLLYCTDGTPPAESELSLLPEPAIDSEPALAPAPEPVPVPTPPRVQPTVVTRTTNRRTPPSVAVPTIATPPVLKVAAKPNSAPVADAPAPAPVSTPKIAAPTIAAPAPASDGPPSTEQFRQELLAVVSARTGYPPEALDETLHMEAALGIDSIKTVEIFSNLKAYHKYFRADGQEEEELLAEFSKLKTLRDIINSYDRRRQAHLPAAADSGEASHTVKRYDVAPVAAPMHINGSKKNYLTPTSSSSSARYAS
jgi:acyl transferase domain-containing protein/NAD(P)H-dependent flavin oxidoreductase YrpB (nitropropane dioxygenase family)